MENQTYMYIRYIAINSQLLRSDSTKSTLHKSLRVITTDTIAPVII